MVPDGPRVVNMTVASDRSVNIRCGVAPFAPAWRQLVQDVMGLLHPLLGLDVRGSGLPGRAFDGHGHRRDLPDRLLLVAIEALRLGRIEIQRWLLIEIPPASIAVVLVQRHGAFPLGGPDCTLSQVRFGRQSILHLDTGGFRWVGCEKRRFSLMPVLLRKFKLPNGVMQQDRIDEPERIERYLKLFEKEDVKKLQTGKWVWIEKDEWKLIPD